MRLNCHLFYLRERTRTCIQPLTPKTSRNLRGGESYLIFKQSTKTKTDEKKDLAQKNLTKEEHYIYTCI